MRARNIKPGFFKNEELVKLPESVRLLFIGLWCMADRKGRMEDRPARIKMEIYPCDQHDISTMLDQLQHHGFILRYEVRGNRYIQIINFAKHQYPHIKEQESTIPAPCKPGANTILARLNPDVLNPDVLNPESLSPAAPEAADVFEKLWKNYPRRLGKKTAYRHFLASVKTDVDVSNILAALENYRRYVNGKEPQFIQHGSTWFNNWRDWINYQEDKNAPDGRPSPISYAALARAKREAEKVRENVTPVPAGVGDLPDVQAQTHGGYRNGHGNPGALVQALGSKSALESEQDRGESP